MPPARGAPARRLLLLLATLAGTLLIYYFHPGRTVSLSDLNGLAEAARARDEQHFSPAENLEQLDHERLERARHTIDIAMYAFTDRYLAEELVTIARRGVRIRIYRDRQQYEEEQRNARERNRPSTSEMLRGESNIQLRIKAAHELMHLKAYLVDGRLLRDGSANWSSSGLKRQDNNLHFTADPAQVRVFQQEFEQMWNRPDNEKAQ